MSQRIVASDGNPNDQFGRWLDVDGDLMAVSAYNRQQARGAIYVFEREGPGQPWEEVAILTVPGAPVQLQLGISVAVSNDTIAAGTYEHVDGKRDAGSVYVFRKGEDW